MKDVAGEDNQIQKAVGEGRMSLLALRRAIMLQFLSRGGFLYSLNLSLKA